MQAIQTRYAGCHFRSRLEARWAVFLDHVGIQWQYEYQGFACPYRLTLEEGRFPYLPDFWLPELGLFVEVKGSLTGDEVKKVLNSAAHLSESGHDMLVFGHLPNEGHPRVPWRLSWRKGDLIGYPWVDLYGQMPNQMDFSTKHLFGSDNNYLEPQASRMLTDMAEPLFWPVVARDAWHAVLDNKDHFLSGYRAAREERF